MPWIALSLAATAPAMAGSDAQADPLANVETSADAPAELVPIRPVSAETTAASAEVTKDAQDEIRAKNAELERQRADLEQVEEVAPAELNASDLPKPCSGPWDWVNLSSGEWLRGELKRMRKNSLEFQSTRMKRQTIDWKHVVGFCFPGDTRFVLTDHTRLVGSGRLRNGLLTVKHDEVSQWAPRSDIWTILPGAPTELNRWRANLSVGLDAYTGNTNQQSVTASVGVHREASTTHLGLDYTTSFGRSNGVDNVKQHRASGEYDVYFDRVWFATLPFVDYLSDTFQNIQQRVTPGLSIGAKPFDLGKFEWDMTLGLAYQYTQYVSVQAGESNRENDLGPRFQTNLEWDIVKDLKFKFGHTTVLLVRDFDQTNFHTQGSLIYDVTDLIYLEFSVWYDRVLQPRPTVSGSVPSPNDVRTAASIGLSFD